MRLELLVTGQARQTLNFNGAQTLSQSQLVIGGLFSLLRTVGWSLRSKATIKYIGPYSFLTMCMISLIWMLIELDSTFANTFAFYTSSLSHFHAFAFYTRPRLAWNTT